MKIFASTLALTIAMAAGSAQAAVIDFQSLEVNNNSVNPIGNSYSEDGFQLTKGTDEAYPFSVFGTDEWRYPGSTALFNDTIGGAITLSKLGGAVFSLASIDLAELNGPYSVTVNFLGTLLGGGTVSASFTTDGSVGFQTFAFGSGFTNLLSVSWTQDSPFHQFDNIVVDAPSPVPVPAAGLLLAGALGGLGALRRRKTA